KTDPNNFLFGVIQSSFVISSIRLINQLLVSLIRTFITIIFVGRILIS
ncbi:hypothetical protein LINGRAHAP2_LOCUS18068, partial [Linum grandiflorum]